MKVCKIMFTPKLLAGLTMLGLFQVSAFAQSTPSSKDAPNVAFSTSRVTFSQTGGEALYRASCQGCHMADGKGAKGAGFYPPLANNPKLAAAGYSIHVVMNGFNGMPGFAQRMDDQQVADVVNYIRTNFGNSSNDPVKAVHVQPFRTTK